MKDKILSIMEEIMKMESSEIIANWDSVDVWDSLIKTEIIFSLEDEFGFFFEEDEIERMTTPHLLIDLVLNKDL